MRKAVARPPSEQNLGTLPNHARNAERKARRAEGVDDWRELVSRRWLTAPNGRPIIVPIKSIQKNRAYHSQGEVFLSPFSGPDAVVHELGHAVEFFHPDVLRSSLAFYDRRTAGEAVKKLRDLSPGHGYRVGEITRKDAFIDAYVGREYGRRATEIFSMGIEYMAKDPLEFWRKDPEHFTYIWDIMRGIVPQ